MALFEAHHLSKRFGDRVVLEDISLSFEQGQLSGIMGPNGAGKSTCFNVLTGHFPPDRGHVLLDGQDITGLSPRKIAQRGVARSFQIMSLFDEFTVLENAMMPGIIRGAPSDETESAARQILERVGLGPRLTHKVGEISGGEQQRVAIARALSGGPPLLLADEPTGNLDQTTGESVFFMIRELHAERGLTSILVTHNDKLAAQCDEVWEMGAGKLQNLNCSQ